MLPRNDEHRCTKFYCRPHCQRHACQNKNETRGVRHCERSFLRRTWCLPRGHGAHRSCMVHGTQVLLLHARSAACGPRLKVFGHACRNRHSRRALPKIKYNRPARADLTVFGCCTERSSGRGGFDRSVFVVFCASITCHDAITKRRARSPLASGTRVGTSWPSTRNNRIAHTYRPRWYPEGDCVVSTCCVSTLTCCISTCCIPLPFVPIKT